MSATKTLIKTTMQCARPARVAVIGLGAAGLTATKNLVEQGFDVTAFDRNDEVGGLWTFKDDPTQTTVLRTTQMNGSKQTAPYHDFPFPDELPNYPSAEQVSQYMRDYAKHFSLYKHFRFKTEIQLISPLGTTATKANNGDRTERGVAASEGNVGWEIRLRDASGQRVETFDKVLVTSGPWSRPYTPTVPGLEDFRGQIVHSQAFKTATGYEGKRVMIVGMANTACDIAVDLCHAGAEVFMSHRHGVIILRREDTPVDHQITRRRFLLGAAMNNRFPALTSYLGRKVLEREFRKANPDVPEEWGFFPYPPLWAATGVVNDKLVQMMVEGKVHNRHGIKRFTETAAVTTTRDGRDEVETLVDTVIFATSEDFDYSILHPDADPTRASGPDWERIKHTSNDLAMPRLYQTLFSTRYPQSLAFIGPCRGFSIAALSNYDLASQAISQVWLGHFSLPDRDAMERWCDGMSQRTLEQAKVYRIGKTGIDGAALEHWLNEAAGTGVNAKLGWGWEAWKFWWSDRRLYGLLMDGVQSPHLYRLFEGRPGARRKWDGARDAIFRANGRVQQ